MLENVKKFFTPEKDQDLGDTVGSIAKLIGHILKFAFFGYSMVHGVSASMNYAGSSEWQRAFQVAGIIVIEFSLVFVYLKAVTGKIEGAPQAIAAGATYLIGFAFAMLGIVADSQINAQEAHIAAMAAAGVVDLPAVALSPWLETYIMWILPMSPGVAALGVFAIDMTEPDKIQERKENKLARKMKEEEIEFELAMKRADMRDRRMQAAIQLETRQTISQHLNDIHKSSAAQNAIAQTAIKQLPQLMAQAGVVMPTVIEAEEIERNNQATQATQPPAEPTIMATHVPVTAPAIIDISGERKPATAHKPLPGDKVAEKKTATIDQPSAKNFI